MALAIQHRGPDDAGAWADAPAGIALGHRRLSIVDLSAAGHQPMQSACGRFVLAFNGEIYNHLALRAELKGLECRAALVMTDAGADAGDGLPRFARNDGEGSGATTEPDSSSRGRRPWRFMQEFHRRGLPRCARDDETGVFVVS